MLLHDDVQGVLLEPGGHAGGVAHADGAQALVQAQLQQVIHGGVAGGGAQQALSARHRLRGHLREHGALAGARGAVDEEEVLGGQGARHGVRLLGVEGAGGLELLRLVEARGLVAEEHLALAALGALVERLHALQAGAHALVGDVVGDDVQAQQPLVDEGRRGAIEGELDAGPGGARDEGACGLLHLGAARHDRHEIAVVERGGEGGAIGAGEREEDAPAEAHLLLDALQVEDGEAVLGALAQGHALGEGGGAGALGIALHGEEPAELVEEGDVARHGHSYARGRECRLALSRIPTQAPGMDHRGLLWQAFPSH